ncbi:MAG: GNAT family N-acetyltransferase, partial [Proteobacteria bacterium]|nr:GNAT family N-acetyltransferase [Pseudomonadota bacterium]
MDGDGAEPLTARTAESFASIDAAAWDRCAGGDNPFVSHRFLQALEQSGCATASTGWTPRPILLETPSGELAAAAPAYLKTHSYGEYVFDHGWADAFERAGGRYYPKLQVSSPFTPAPGPRLLAAGPNRAHRLDALARAIAAATRAGDASSAHVTFCTEDEWQLLGEVGYLRRVGEQFHWRNEGYETFDHFLAALASRKRKAVRRERRTATAGGAITIRALEGADITGPQWDAFFAFYLDTGSRKWGTPYLNRAFFRRIAETMADDIVLVLAEQDSAPVAAALNFKGGGVLYGRYWGTRSTQPALHFEVCYYQAIDYAIRHRLRRVEAGAQGPHKLARGYLPVRTYSAHWIADPAFRDAVAEYLDRERRLVDDEIGALAALAPYRQA